MHKRIICLFVLLNIVSLLSFASEKKLQKILSINMPEQTEILSLDEGKVLNIGYDVESGNFIEVEYDKLGMIIKYCNLNTMKVLKKQIVSKKQILGFSGITGAVAEPTMNVKASIDYESKKEFNLADYVSYVDGMAIVYSAQNIKYIELRFFSSMFQTEFFFCLNGDEITGYNKRIEYEEPYELKGATENVLSVFSYNKSEIENDTDNVAYIKLGLSLLE